MAKRPAHFCKRIVDRIIEGVAMGNSLKKSLHDAGPLAPTPTTFWRWMEQYPEVGASYQRALQFQASMNADLMLDLAHEALATPAKAPAIRVAVDILKWHAEMRDPALYSPKGAQTHQAPPKTLKQMQDEVERLQKELGVEAQPGMVTAPKVLREKQGEGKPDLTVVPKVVGES